MTNKEKYYNKIINIALANADIAMNKNTSELTSCAGIQCVQCKFNEGGLPCKAEKLKWLNEEYIEPETDWSKVEVDTPILVKNIESQAWIVKYFAKYEDGKVWCWSDGKTSYTTKSVCDWDFTKLPTPEELEQHRKKA
mgnify:CR=1 FL=1